jgi:hypothetical protein
MKPDSKSRANFEEAAAVAVDSTVIETGSAVGAAREAAAIDLHATTNRSGTILHRCSRIRDRSASPEIVNI